MNTPIPTIGPIVHLQVASDGRWEEAIHITKEGISDVEITRWLNAASQNLAIEAFVPIAYGLAFFGVRLSIFPGKLQREIIKSLILSFLKSNEMYIDTFTKIIETLTDSSLFTTAPKSLELGKVNAWESFRSVNFWSFESGLNPLDCFREALIRNPRFEEPSCLPFAIEFKFVGKLPHWQGLPISISDGSTHLINEDLVREVFSFSFP